MGRFRKWINRDDGKYYRVGNRSLHLLEIIGMLLMVLGLLLLQIRHKQINAIPIWMLIHVFVAAALLATGAWSWKNIRNLATAKGVKRFRHPIDGQRESFCSFSVSPCLRGMSNEF